MDKKSKPYCTVPWHSLCLGPTGEFGACCMMQRGLGKTSEGDTLESVWNGEKLKHFREDMLNENYPKGCLECKEKERNGVLSARNILMEQLGRFTDREEYTNETSDDQLYHLDISLSNKCNLKCRFCCSDNSSSWIKERDKLAQTLPSAIRYYGNNTQVVDVNPNELLSFISKLDNLKQIELKGGEPFMSVGHVPLLEHLIASGKAKNLKILYTTNGTMIDDHCFELFKEFRQISMTVSVDGTGSVYSYVRGGHFSFENDIVPQLRRLNGMTGNHHLLLNMHFVVNAYNLLNLPNFLRWYTESGINSTLSLGLVEVPRFLSPKILPREIIDKALRQLAEFDLEEVKRLCEGLRNLPDAPSLRLGFYNYTENIDRLRGVSLVEAVPELADFYLSIPNSL